MAFQIKRNDTAPSITATLQASSTAVDIQNATVRFHMLDSGGAVVVDAAANNDQVTDGSDGSTGKVSYDWAAADTDVAGTFRAEWEVTFSDGTIRTFPTPGYTTVIIHGDLA